MSIHQRLERWGSYMQTQRDFGLGFPKRTVLHRCIVEGPAAGAPSGKMDEPVPQDVEEVEAAINRVPERDKALAIKIYVEKQPVPTIRRDWKVPGDLIDDMINRMHSRIESELWTE